MKILLSLLHRSEYWVCQEKHGCKLKAMGIGYLTCVFGKTRKDEINSECISNECALNTKMNDQYERSSLAK